jgi:tetratricopeptide (TPR) repeat protein
LLDSGSISYRKTTPFYPFTQLLNFYFQIKEQDTQLTVSEKITGQILSYRPGPAALLELPTFLYLHGVPPQSRDWENLDPGQRRRRILDAVRNLLLHESENQPVILILEDLHWLDSESQALLDEVAESISEARFLLMVNYRPEYRHEWSRHPHFSEVRMDSLSAESANEMLGHMLGDDEGLTPLKALLVRHANSNPFFLEEYVQTLLETGALSGSEKDRDWQESPQVPANLQSLIAARIDRLPPMKKQILQTATVVGMEIPLSLLRVISELSEDELLHGMKNLVIGGYLYEASLFPEHTYTFKHALTHEVAYGTLLQSRRKRIHADILSAIESGAGDRIEELWERLAHHARSGEVWEKAVLYYSSAGKKAMDRSALREAIHFFEEALAALKKLPAAASDEAAIDLRFGLRNCLVSLGRFDRVPEYLNEAGDLAARIGDDSRRGWVSCYFAQHYWTVGNLAQAVESGRQASDIAKSAGDLSLAVATNFYLGLAYHTQGEYPKAGQILAENVSSIEGEHRYDRFDLAYLPSVASMSWLAWSLAEAGEFSEGAEISAQAIEIAEKVGQPYSLTMAYLGAGTLYLRKGDLEKAVSHLEQALDHYSKNEVPIWFS